MESSGFFNSVGGDRKYTADFFSQYFADFISNGVYPNPSTMCQIIANGNMTVTEKAGNAYINGQKYKNDSDNVLAIEIADGVLNRIDRIVLRHTILDREIKAYVKKGTFASTPVAPTLQRDADIYEIGLADIYVGAGAISITQANITDLRLNNSYCGIVHGVVIQVDTTTLFNQYQAWITEKQNQFNTSLIEYAAEKQIEIDQTEASLLADWNVWFAEVQNTLSGDVAGNLLLLIQSNDDDIELLQAKITAGIITPNWTGSAIPYTQTISNVNVTATNSVEISLAPTATEDETIAFDILGLKDGGQTAGAFTLRCWNVQNSINIPVVITVRGA